MAANTKPGALTISASCDAAYRPNIVDLSSGVARAWPTIPDLALSVLLCVATVSVTDEYFGHVTAICGGLEATILALLVTRYVRVRPHRLPWIEFLFAAHYSEFGLSVLNDPSPIGFRETIPWQDSFDFAASLALVSGLAMLAAFALVRRGAVRFNGEAVFPKLDAGTLSKGARIYFALTVSYLILDQSAAIRGSILPAKGILGAFFSLSTLLIVTTSAYLSQPKVSNLAQMLAAFLLVVHSVADSSMLGDAVAPLLAVAALWWRGRERVPLVPLVLVAATLVVLQPVKSYYRELRWNNQPSVGILDAWQEAFSLYSADSHSAFGNSRGGTDATINRLGELTSLAYIVEVVPASVPHTGGLIYPMMLVSWVPRLLWPDKPNMTRYALDPFAIALGLIEKEGTESTTTGVNLVGQGYLEHGIVGSLGWMALVGVMLALASRYFTTQLSGTIAGATLLAPLAQAMQGGFYNTFGSLWQMLFAATVLVWILWLLGRGYQSPHRTTTAS